MSSAEGLEGIHGPTQLDLQFLDGAGDAFAHQDDLHLVGDALWKVNNSSLADYAARASFYGDPGSLIEIIDDQIGQDEANAGLDIAAGSYARALRDLLDSGVIGRALATNYEDRRPLYVSRDERIGHVQGSLTEAGPWAGMRAWRDQHAPQGFALTMHRPVGGLQKLPYKTYFGAAHFILDMVRSHGMLFTQVPRSLVEDAVPLSYLCASIRERPDVRDIIVSPPKPEGTFIDWADTYAVILKR